MTHAKRQTAKTTLRLPKLMRREIDRLLMEDGRSFAEWSRSLFSQAIREQRQNRMAPQAAR